MNAMANPYTAQLFEASTRLRVNPFDTGLLNSLVAFAVLFGIADFFALASLALRWRNGTLWVCPLALVHSDDDSMVRTFGGQCADDSLSQFFRTVATRQGPLVVCHESNVHTLFSIAFLAAVRRDPLRRSPNNPNFPIPLRVDSALSYSRQENINSRYDSAKLSHRKDIPVSRASPGFEC